MYKPPHTHTQTGDDEAAATGAAAAVGDDKDELEL
jgi:hypothetical protein